MKLTSAVAIKTVSDKEWTSAGKEITLSALKNISFTQKNTPKFKESTSEVKESISEVVRSTFAVVGSYRRWNLCFSDRKNCFSDRKISFRAKKRCFPSKKICIHLYLVSCSVQNTLKILLQIFKPLRRSIINWQNICICSEIILPAYKYSFQFTLQRFRRLKQTVIFRQFWSYIKLEIY